MRKPIIWTARRQALALAAVLFLPACAAHYTTVPARVDLQRYGTVALVSFAVDGPATDLGDRTTARFVEELLASQWGVEVIEMRSLPDAPDPRIDPKGFAQALGRDGKVPAVFVGQLSTRGVSPTGGVGGPAGISVRADVAAELQVQLLSTESGGTLWRGSGQAARTIGAAATTGGLPSVAVRNPDRAYGEVVNEMVAEATRDFRPTRVRQ